MRYFPTQPPAPTRTVLAQPPFNARSLEIPTKSFLLKIERAFLFKSPPSGGRSNETDVRAGRSSWRKRDIKRSTANTQAEVRASFPYHFTDGVEIVLEHLSVGDDDSAIASLLLNSRWPI